MEKRFAELYERYGKEVPTGEFQSREECNGYIWEYSVARGQGKSHEEAVAEWKKEAAKPNPSPQTPLTAEEQRKEEYEFNLNISQYTG